MGVQKCNRGARLSRGIKQEPTAETRAQRKNGKQESRGGGGGARRLRSVCRVRCNFTRMDIRRSRKALLPVLQAGGDERREERMWSQRTRFELRVELAAQKP